jgi:hypothetical protein
MKPNVWLHLITTTITFLNVYNMITKMKWKFKKQIKIIPSHSDTQVGHTNTRCLIEFHIMIIVNKSAKIQIET